MAQDNQISPQQVQQLIVQLLARMNNNGVKGPGFGDDLAPILGVLTDTYTPEPQHMVDTQALEQQYMKTWSTLEDSEMYPDGSPEKYIASSIANGIPLLEIRKRIPQLLADMKVDPNGSTQSEMLNLANTLQSEKDNYETQLQKSSTEKQKDTWWSKAGIANPQAQYNPDDYLQPAFQALAEKYAPIEHSGPPERFRAISGKPPAQQAQKLTYGGKKQYGGAFMEWLTEKLIPGSYQSAQQKAPVPTTPTSAAYEKFGAPGSEKRVAMVNEQRAARAERIAQGMREMVAGQIQKSGATPAKDQLMQRILSSALGGLTKKSG